MAEKKVGRAVSWHPLTPGLSLFRVAPEPGSPFPDYKPGQYIALGRQDCWLTRRVTDADGKVHYSHDVDEHGQPRRGPVMHSYSISSAPYETREHGWLEFYVVLEMSDNQYPGRLTESLFRMRPGTDDKLDYVNRIAGDFTLDKRAQGVRNVLMVGTGTGLAPFAAMVKQLRHEAGENRTDGLRYTLLHANRTFDELAYHELLLEIEAAGAFDFVYLPSVSRPSPQQRDDPGLAQGRGNNVLRHVLGLPLREEEDLKLAEQSGGDVGLARAAVERAVKPTLPPRLDRRDLLARLEPSQTVLLTCGNPSSMADIRVAAEAVGMRFEKEDWKLVLPTPKA
jgi:ferredoxin-NADP reductase